VRAVRRENKRSQSFVDLRTGQYSFARDTINSVLKKTKGDQTALTLEETKVKPTIRATNASPIPTYRRQSRVLGLNGSPRFEQPILPYIDPSIPVGT